MMRFLVRWIRNQMDEKQLAEIGEDELRRLEDGYRLHDDILKLIAALRAEMAVADKMAEVLRHNTALLVYDAGTDRTERLIVLGQYDKLRGGK